MPQGVRNITQHVMDFAVYALYPYVSRDAAPHAGKAAPEQTARLGFVMSPDQQYWSLEIVTPKNRIAFEDVKSNKLAKAIFPITVTQGIMSNIRDEYLKSESQPSCTVENNFVSTFDNVTYKFNPRVASGCYYVLAQESSRTPYPVAIAAKNLGTSNMAVKILLPGNTKIELGHAAAGSNGAMTSGSDATVMINGSPRPLPAVVRSGYGSGSAQGQSGNYIAKIRQMPNGGVQVETQTVQVAFDGKRIFVQGHNIMRNSTAGICGNFDGEKVQVQTNIYEKSRE